MFTLKLERGGGIYFLNETSACGIHVCMHMYEYALCAYVYMYICTEEYINFKLTYSHSKLSNFTIIKNKWTVLKLL